MMDTEEHGALIGPGGKKGEEQSLKLPTSDRIQAAGMDQVYLRQVLPYLAVSSPRLSKRTVAASRMGMH